MNAFAESVFNALLSWLRLTSQRLLRLFSSDGNGGFLTWLGDHWLATVLLLSLVGLVIDYVVWICRWRPDLAWRTRWRHFKARMSGEEMRRRDTQQFAQGYQDGGFFQAYMTADSSSEEEGRGPDQEEPEAEPESVPERQPYVRQYRSSGKRKARALRQWMEGSDDGQQLDRLPVSVDQRQAFHDPVYPEKINPDDYQ